jgi:hypothetical protein
MDEAMQEFLEYAIRQEQEQAGGTREEALQRVQAFFEAEQKKMEQEDTE